MMNGILTHKSLTIVVARGSWLALRGGREEEAAAGAEEVLESDLDLLLRNSSQLREAVMVLRRSKWGKRRKKARHSSHWGQNTHWGQNCSILGDSCLLELLGTAVS
jgi:hypothetical protein